MAVKRKHNINGRAYTRCSDSAIHAIAVLDTHYSGAVIAQRHDTRYSGATIHAIAVAMTQRHTTLLTRNVVLTLPLIKSAGGDI